MDAVCVGEMLIDFTPGAEPDSYVKHAGGAPANVAVALRRNGLESGFIGKLGADDFGSFLKETLDHEGVEILCQPFTEEAVTTLAFVTLYAGGERSFTFARKPGADLLLCETDISETQLRQCRLIHGGSVSLSGSPAREATLRALELGARAGKLVSFDVNYREMIWGRDQAKREVERALPFVDLLKISDEETDFVGGEEGVWETMRRFGIAVVVQTLGAAGARYYFDGKTELAAGKTAVAVDATGAGDAFWGGFLSKLLLEGVQSRKELSRELIQRALEYGNCAGALCVQKKGGIPALPRREEIEEAYGKNGGTV